MITILTTIEHYGQVKEYINSVDRLDELVYVSTENDHKFPVRIKIKDNLLECPIDWLDQTVPYSFPALDLDCNNFLAFVFYSLGNHQKAFEYIDEHEPIFNHLIIATYLQFGYIISNDLLKSIKDHLNFCILNHYGNVEKRMNYESLYKAYSELINSSTDPELKAFSLKHFTNLLLDNNDFNYAEILIKSQLKTKLSKPAEIALKSQLASALMGQLKLPYQEDALDAISQLQRECLEYFEEEKDLIKIGMLSIEAAEIANFKGVYIESKNLLNQAIGIFKQEDIPELLGEASLRKATLLYKWSKNGSPQYYKPAINAFQDTLKLFKRNSHPEKFADIHHNLAIIYSEIPASSEEKAIWSAFCASSFKEALSVYKKETQPYEFAMVCHNYATALLGFPEAKLHNNLDKAFGLFENALDIRTKQEFPLERSLSLLNQLELMWLMHNENSDDEYANYEIMLHKANEIKKIAADPTLIAKADEQIEALENLKTVLK
ncbi:MAG: hypothetical protein AAGH46_00300 [Bacteroidota bacterium]